MAGKEKSLQNTILEEVGALPYVRLWRANVGVARPLNDPTSVVRYGIKGQADLTGALRCGRRLEVEVKAPMGRRSAEQVRFAAMARAFGMLYVEARTVDDVRAALTPHLQTCPQCFHAEPWVPTC